MVCLPPQDSESLCQRFSRRPEDVLVERRGGDEPAGDEGGPMARNMEDDIFTPEEAAEMLGVKLMTLYQWVHRKKIKCFRIGYGQQRIRFRRHEVESLVDRRRAPRAEKARTTVAKKTKKPAKARRRKIDIEAVVKESLESKKRK